MNRSEEEKLQTAGSMRLMIDLIGYEKFQNVYFIIFFTFDGQSSKKCKVNLIYSQKWATSLSPADATFIWNFWFSFSFRKPVFVHLYAKLQLNLVNLLKDLFTDMFRKLITFTSSVYRSKEKETSSVYLFINDVLFISRFFWFIKNTNVTCKYSIS